MTLTEPEILNQPDHWRRTLALARSYVDQLRPLFSRPVVFVGAGSSYYVGLAGAAYLEERVGARARAVPASLYRPAADELPVFISRSGTTTEILEGARAARQTGVASVAITCDAANPLVSLADTPVVLDFVREQSIVQTGSATSAFLFLRALADLLAGRPAPEALVAQVAQALKDPVHLHGAVSHLVALGSGWRFGIACEAALKAQEMALLWTERYVPLEYRHGPMSCADEATLVAILDPVEPPIRQLIEDIEATGATVLTPRYDPLVELVRLQQVALKLSLQRGLNPDRPRNLARSVVLRAASDGHEGVEGRRG